MPLPRFFPSRKMRSLSSFILPPRPDKFSRIVQRPARTCQRMWRFKSRPHLQSRPPSAEAESPRRWTSQWWRRLQSHVLEFPTMNERPKLALASNSPRRKELLALGGWKFEIIVSDADESLLADEAPRDYVRRLAAEKARASSARADASQVVVAADTTVVDGNAILGKPAGTSEAKRMLRQLRGRVHQVYTGIAVLRVRDGNLSTDVCV
ncbi:MAG: hypothetical protein COS37_07280, partial [Anaerolineae bacterium CG03_land_8_20_14_0_80_58_20]